MEEYLKVSEVIDWQSPAIIELAKQIASGHETTTAIAKACFEWVRDEIYHSVDYQMNPVTCRASDVLKYKTGYCYAKSHLLAAVLRANQIPAGFCYQRLSIDDKGAPYSLHGFNAIYLPDVGWYRVDARGNKEGVNAQFVPPQERLAFKIQFPGEADFQSILAEPLQIIVEALQGQATWDDMLRHLPDISLESAKGYGLVIDAIPPANHFPSKDGFPHFMLQEIHHQPKAVQTCLSTYLPPHSRSYLQAHFPFHEIHIIASGTSRHAGLIAQFWLEHLAGIPTRVRSGSEFLAAPFPITPHTLTIGVTQSGETADTLQALACDQQRRSQRSQEEQSYLLGITNQATSSLATQVDILLPTLAGAEIGVAATKTFTTQLVVFFLLALTLAEQRQTLDREHRDHAIAALHQLPTQIQQVLQQTDWLQPVATRLVEAQHCILLGRGMNQAIALEGALKLKETSYLHAEGYAAGEFMHGPIALLDEHIPVIAIVPPDRTQAAMIGNVRKVRSHGSPVIGIVTTDNAAATASLFDTQIVLPSVDELLSPLLTVIPLQLLAYTTAVLRGLNVDRPRYITKTLA